ncbi:hypothetical protein [Kitasatospora sp. NPDC059571]|uniref:hypothetical protein n=1 Tax=Kitasatospora sp. NPDC059571 TaxID=3346871 RepID=UPI00369F5FD2
MSTWSGIGTKCLGFGHRQADGSHHATRWAVLFDLPVIPLRRHRLRVGATLHTRLGNGSRSVTRYEMLGEDALVVREVLTTYLVYWIIGPVLALGPVVAPPAPLGGARLGFLPWLLILGLGTTWAIGVPVIRGVVLRNRLGLPKG